ncbi:MAG: NUDIX hydrolase [Candidatus Saccharimonas sp.]
MDKRRVNVRAIVWRDGKVLAVKHREGDGEAQFWCIPGGGLDPHESLVDGVAREMLEETGVEVNVGKLLFIQQFESRRSGFDEELELFFHVEDTTAFDMIDLATTSHGTEEIAEIAFVDQREVKILPTFLSTIDIESYIETNKSVYLNDSFNERT